MPAGLWSSNSFNAEEDEDSFEKPWEIKSKSFSSNFSDHDTPDWGLPDWGSKPSHHFDLIQGCVPGLKSSLVLLKMSCYVLFRKESKKYGTPIAKVFQLFDHDSQLSSFRIFNKTLTW